MVERKLYLDKIKSFVDVDLIKIITGIRRCGKSYFFKLIINFLIENGVNEDNILLIDLELPKFNHIKTREQLDEIVLEFLEEHHDKTYLFFDEIQNVSQWEISINGYFKLSNVDIYITGSNSKLLSKELATFLTGRYISIEMYPFSFNEFIDFKEELNQKAFFENEFNTDIENYFEEYISYGGLPVTIDTKNHKEITLKDLYSSILLHDIVERYEIRNIGLFSRITKFILENIGNLISAHSIYTYLKHEKINITKSTIYNYLEYLQNAYILSKITREDLIGKKEINGSEKFYIMDQGFYKSQLEEKQLNIGRILENIIYLELLRNDCKVTVGTINNYEIDFVCKKDNKKFYIQVAYHLYDEKTIDREFRPLKQVDDNYPKYVLTMDRQDYSRDGIVHMNIIKFLREFFYE
ncbi:ATP-binding protein [Methanobrevibacter millerae]|uniref:ATPase n=1 Tax=Methanobrevibacter millerae TaxID=230361 RepID=A0A0U3EJQ5_9EURY|nr:ATP-binding protein [Methanobrevibacter millerae]ALT68797.1 ATPase [Methanobrevibacter millerae]